MSDAATGQSSECVGLFGRIFGHKFKGGGYTGWSHCLRCGMPKGGWRA